MENQTNPIQPTKQVPSGRKKAGLALVIICPIVFVLFLPAYTILSFVFSSTTAEISLTTQGIVKIIFQILPILAIIGFPVGLYLMMKKKHVPEPPSSGRIQNNSNDDKTLTQ